MSIYEIVAVSERDVQVQFYGSIKLVIGGTDENVGHTGPSGKYISGHIVHSIQCF